ncbi:TetR/AcrR family transcriptional regulator [Cohnella soli]|uniref:TetR/AcrR family transcriptional regulator C-terminal domain-containing protein n=1 Tax=Cohnella soli TaxID=425005 RepID=A0ABW0HZJ9_9BACL
MADKLDRRQVRTKQLLYEALMSLIEERGSDNITVTDIANRANVNRGTFYLHYRDVDDMLQQLKDDVFEHVRAYVEQLNIMEAISYADREDVYPPSVKIFEAFAEHADFLRVMCGPNGDSSYLSRFRDLMASRIKEMLKSITEDQYRLPPDYLIAYMSSANLGVLLHWLQMGMNQTPTQMAKLMARVINYGPLVSLGIKKPLAAGTQK